MKNFLLCVEPLAVLFFSYFACARNTLKSEQPVKRTKTAYNRGGRGGEGECWSGWHFGLMLHNFSFFLYFGLLVLRREFRAKLIRNAICRFSNQSCLREKTFWIVAAARARDLIKSHATHRWLIYGNASRPDLITFVRFALLLFLSAGELSTCKLAYVRTHAQPEFHQKLVLLANRLSCSGGGSQCETRLGTLCETFQGQYHCKQ